MRNLISGGVLMGIFKVQECFVPRKSIFDLFGRKWPARMVTVNNEFFATEKSKISHVYTCVQGNQKTRIQSLLRGGVWFDTLFVPEICTRWWIHFLYRGFASPRLKYCIFWRENFVSALNLIQKVFFPFQNESPRKQMCLLVNRGRGECEWSWEKVDGPKPQKWTVLG